MPIQPIVTSSATLAALTSKGSKVTFDVPDPLLDFLQGLCLLNDVPFTALVADPALLPPESLRFLYVDPSWQRALVEGALSATSSGTADDDERLECFRGAVLDALHARRDGGPTDRVTGLLLRSAIVRYVPKLQVRAWSTTNRDTTPLPVLRFERLSQNILLVLWNGKPARVEIEEPRTAAWFGVDGGRLLEAKKKDGVGVVDEDTPPADLTKEPLSKAPLSKGSFTARLRSNAGGRAVIDIASLAADITSFKNNNPLWTGNKAAADSADLALHLQQQPYRQVFQGTKDAKPDLDLTPFPLENLLDFTEIAASVRNALVKPR